MVHVMLKPTALEHGSHTTTYSKGKQVKVLNGNISMGTSQILKVKRLKQERLIFWARNLIKRENNQVKD